MNRFFVSRLIRVVSNNRISVSVDLGFNTYRHELVTIPGVNEWDKKNAHYPNVMSCTRIIIPSDIGIGLTYNTSVPHVPWEKPIDVTILSDYWGRRNASRVGVHPDYPAQLNKIILIAEILGYDPEKTRQEIAKRRRADWDTPQQ